MNEVSFDTSSFIEIPNMFVPFDLIGLRRMCNRFYPVGLEIVIKMQV